MTVERWKPAKGHEKHCEVSTLGRVRRVSGKKRATIGTITTGGTKPGEYRTYTYQFDRVTYAFKVHRAVALAFLRKPTNPLRRFVNHKNGDPSDNRLCNLEWVTDSENKRHSLHILGRGNIGPMKNRKRNRQIAG